MPHANIRSSVALLTGNGLGGPVTIAPTTILLPHTHVTLFSAGAGGRELVVVSIDDTTGIVTLRDLPTELNLSASNLAKNLSYGSSADLSAWTVAGGARLFIHEQLVPVENLYRGKA